MKAETKKIAKKDLEKSIVDKFMQGMTDLGHDAQTLKKEIKKASKFLVKKIDRKIKEYKGVSEPVAASPRVKKSVEATEKIKKEVAKKATKVEGVLAKAAKTAEKKIKKVAADIVTPEAESETAELITTRKRGRKQSAPKPENFEVPVAKPKVTRAKKTTKTPTEGTAEQ